MTVRNSSFTGFIDYFTTNTYIMVIMSDPSNRTSSDRHRHTDSSPTHTHDVETATTQLNIKAARQVFEKHVQQES